MEERKQDLLEWQKENRKKLNEHFPSLFHQGILVRSEWLKLFGEDTLHDDRYGLFWPSKRTAIQEASLKPAFPTPTLNVACSKNASETENLYIEGDNLDGLRLLCSTHTGKIQCIYIDPPYNTGKNFIYKDNYHSKMKSKILHKHSSAFDQQWRENMHNDWLTMMYPRLAIARQLLTEDGVILISIDSKEFANLRLICDELYGEQNYVGEFIWSGGRKNDAKFISISHEFILVYGKNVSYLQQHRKVWREKKTGLAEIYKQGKHLAKKYNGQYREASRELKKWFRTLPENHASKQHSHYAAIDEKGVYFPGDISWPGGGGPVYDVLHPVTKKPVKVPARGWAYTEQRMKEFLQADLIHFGIDETTIPCIKRYLHDTEHQVPYSVFYHDGRRAMKRLRKLMDGQLFPFPKDERLMKKVLEIVTQKESIVLDFFAGSSTTAHAVMQLNAEDGGKRKFIMIQLPEAIPATSTAYHQGYRTICELGQERIRRAGEQIFQETGSQQTDYGFRVITLSDADKDTAVD
ncbi:site-specific DNA-methyltransferase [Brevibacillus laterosporus]|uniref:Putative methyltransferase n=1 Tax=Brevibacillus laterosporus LMG 15441 TaxID=1042163 RepID=A0A075REX3_BRELA|nr:site-specific DNA-methyltransferase [Brevibacillus laterosporus]AIG27910.1 putative methyltransferase [Brevibacillus laterosporus LMG 15441]RJL07737.1 site-specific DNA-methyltransferase [Brevibacillus laterosporus]TPH10790.1 site-specific DNA-methyltransferase [Brevibacillus laterosporus]